MTNSGSVAGSSSKRKPTEDTYMKITMTATMAGPAGNARPGTVLDMPEAKAKELMDGHFAREYDATRDDKNQRGLQKPPERYE